MSKLSVITINLNNKTGLSRTISSVLSQTYKDFEYIIIDGGSTDGSLEIINRYESVIDHWISEPDKGIYPAMNKGISIARGEYCFFLNSGDYIADDNVFEKIFSDDPKEDVIYGNLYVTINDKIKERAYGKVFLTFSDVYSHTIKHQASFIRRDLFEKFGLYNENRKIVADWEFFIKSIGLGKASYRFINEFIAYFDNNGISNRNRELAAKERADIIAKNIPVLMQPDFEFLMKHKKYEGLYEKKLTFFFLKVLRKVLLFFKG
jgi:glycosyltransferase involved in cell wall biosynthesis